MRPPTGRCTASSTPSTLHIEPAGLAVEVADRPAAAADVPPAAVARARPRAGPASARCWSPPATGRTTRGCGCPSSTPDGSIRQHRGVTPRPASTSSASASSTGATRASSHGARHDARAVVQHLLRGARPCRRWKHSTRRRRHEQPVRRGRSSAAGWPVPRRRCCSPGPVPAWHWSSAPLRHRHALDPRPHAGRRPAAVPMGPARRNRGRRRHTADPARRRSTTPTASRRTCRSVRAPASTRSTRRAATCSTGSSSTRPPRRARTCATRPL